MATSPIAEANRNQDLAELVWRHFRKEIGQTLAEVQEGLGAPTERQTTR